MTCKYKVKIKDIQYNYKVQMTDIQSKYKFKVFCTGYDDSEIKEKIDAMYEAWPKASGEGETFTLDNTIQAPMKVNLKGNTYQKSTTQSANLFDENYYNNDNLYSVSQTYKNTLTKIAGNKRLYTKCILKEGKTSISGLYLLICSEISPNISGAKQCWLASNGTVIPSSAQDFTDENNIYFTFYPSTVSVSQIFDTYNFMVSTNNTDYVPFVPDSPSPDYPQDVHVVSGENTIMIANEDSSESQNYTIDLGDIELCKIGDYQDYFYKDNGKWYLHKEIGKVVYDGTETNWNRFEIGSNIIQYYRDLNTKHNPNIPLAKSNYFRSGVLSHRSAGYENSVYTYSGGIAFNPNSFPTLEDWKTWLSTHNTEVYYVLATPTTTEITDTTLISQLDVLENAMSYKGQTNISQVNNDAPFIITAKALKDLSNL